jgi:hypothetical protein
VEIDRAKFAHGPFAEKSVKYARWLKTEAFRQRFHADGGVWLVVTEGGLIHPDRAFNFGAFTNLNPNVNPTDRAAILRHERGHMLNNAYFGILGRAHRRR